MQDGHAKDQLIYEITGDLARKDPAAAALAYVNSFQPGSVRDSAAQSDVWSNNTSPPSELVEVARSISGEDERSRVQGVACMRWMREDAVGAKAALEVSNLTDEPADGFLAGVGCGAGAAGGGTARRWDGVSC